LDTLFLFFSKLFWLVVSPDRGLFLILVLGSVLLFTRRKDIGRWLVVVVAGFLLIVNILPIGELLLVPLENRFPVPSVDSKRIDGIIVLGGSEITRITFVRKQYALNEGGERLISFVSFAKRFPKAKLVFSGGSGSLLSDVKESDTARLVFQALGMDISRIEFDAKSRNTYESAANIYQMVKPKYDENWILITSAFHIPRSVGVFRKGGWRVIPYPVDYRSTGKITNHSFLNGISEISGISHWLHEWAGLVGYHLLGRTSELFPGPVEQGG
jgi:uncharacterized SAM-binding protein YcdF (DUF218 family)